MPDCMACGEPDQLEALAAIVVWPHPPRLDRSHDGPLVAELFHLRCWMRELDRVQQQMADLERHGWPSSILES